MDGNRDGWRGVVAEAGRNRAVGFARVDIAGAGGQNLPDNGGSGSGKKCCRRYGHQGNGRGGGKGRC